MHQPCVLAAQQVWCGSYLARRAPPCGRLNVHFQLCAVSLGRERRRLCGGSHAFSACQRRVPGAARAQADTNTNTNTDQLKGTDVEAADMEAMDEGELDELFEEFGEVVVPDSGDRTPTSEVDDDSESLAFAIAIAEAANEVKAGDIKVLFVKPLIYWTRFFVLATGFSKPQIGAIADRIREVGEGYNREPRGDLKANAWTLLDFGDVVVHVFQPKERAYYNLEEFYGNAPVVELPFESRSLD